MESDFQSAGVHLFTESEQMALHRYSLSIERRPRAHVGHRCVDISCDNAFGCINPELRQQLLLRYQIEGREQDRPAPASSRTNIACQRELPSKQRNGVRDISAGNRIANRCARHHLPANFDRRDDLDIKPRDFPYSPSKHTSPAPRCPKQKFAPTMMVPTCMQSTRILSINSSAETRESALSNRKTSAASSPICSKPASLCERV